MGNNQRKPNGSIDDVDIGDDITRRFRFQHAYAALVSLDMLREDSEFDELFCEHHEDVLIKFKNGKYCAYQVKTKEKGLFSFGDETIFGVIKKFIDCEIKYPQHFLHYIIVTNCGFISGTNNSNDIEYCLNCIKNDEKCVELLKNDRVRRRIDKWIAECNQTESFVLSVLKKIKIQKSLSLERYELSLAYAIAHNTNNGDQSLVTLLKIANDLISVIYRASSLPCDNPKEDYLKLHSSPEEIEEEVIIKNKIINKEKIENIITLNLKDTSYLKMWNAKDILKLSKEVRILELKMMDGGINSGDIYYFKGHKISSDALLTKWYRKYGKKEAYDRYQHFGNIVGNECQDSFRNYYEEEELFGIKMLDNITERLRNKYVDIKGTFHDVKYEHLLGIAGILTEECVVNWSKNYEIPEDYI